jgi:hypothetical protein
VLDGTANVWMAAQQRYGFLDQAEVGKRLSRIDQLRQDFACGLADFLPAMRAFR